MARGGVNKALVQTARLALMARGEHPSIDAVRIEMGNTGSKTTIHRYLKELDEHERAHSRPADISDELTELVTRLAQRLQGQAQEKIDEAQTRFDADCRVQHEELIATQKQLTEITNRFNRKTEQLKEQTATLLATREYLQTEQTRNAGLTQANQDMGERLGDKEEQIRSLEEKHAHARDALEHNRIATRQQLEQEQARHERQVLQLQTELRHAQQTATQRQDEVTRLTRDNERLLAQNRSDEREIAAQAEQLEKTTAQAANAKEQLQHSQTRCALLEERTQNAQQESADAHQQLTDQRQQNRVLELILIKTELALENLRGAPQTITAPTATHPDQD
jgi:chromosome segregation ATPase